MRFYAALMAALNAALLFATLVGASATPTAAHAVEAVMERPVPAGTLHWRAAFWRDPTGQADLATVARLPAQDFTPLDRKLSLGFTRDVVWMRIDVDRATDELPRGWWLELDQTVMEDATLFHSQGTDGFVPVQRLDHRRPLFALQIGETGVQRYWLRLATRSSMSTGLIVWQPQALMESNTRETFFWGAVFGAYLLVAVFYLGFWAWTRERIHLVYTAYVLVNLLASLFTGGWPAQMLPEVPFRYWIDLLGLWLSLSLLVGYYFTMVLLRLDQAWPRTARLMLRLTLVSSALGIVGSAAGRYGLVAPGVQLVTVGLILVTMFVGIRMARQGSAEARLFLFGFGVYYFGVAWRYARNFGLIEPSFWNDNSYQIGAFVHILVMSTAIFGGYNRMRREKETAESRASAESRLRTEQQDFTSMVSHEFRTPLSIIGASADNLLQSADLDPRSRQRVEKILKATARMTALMDNYLSKERLVLDSRPLELATMDAASLCRRIAQDLSEGDIGPIRVLVPTQLPLACDAGLLEIALHNLVNNALRHSPPDVPVTLHVMKSSEGVRFEVRDRGPGIPPEEISQVFERFYRGGNALEKPGAGLGLYLVRSIAERHGGRVEVRNVPEGGCAFTLILPG